MHSRGFFGLRTGGRILFWTPDASRYSQYDYSTQKRVITQKPPAAPFSRATSVSLSPRACVCVPENPTRAFFHFLPLILYFVYPLPQRELFLFYYLEILFFIILKSKFNFSEFFFFLIGLAWKRTMFPLRDFIAIGYSPNLIASLQGNLSRRIKSSELPPPN